MSLLSEIFKQQNEDAAAGAISAGSIAANFSSGFKKEKPIKRSKKIKKIFKEDKEYDQTSVMSQIRNAEKHAESNGNVTGFALEDDNGDIVKIFVKKDQAEEFETALNSELEKNKNDEHSHREIGEIVFELKNDFDIVNIEMSTIEEDEEEIDNDIESSSELEIDEDDKDSDDDNEELDLDDMEPTDEVDTSDNTDAKSALDAVIDMMKADAEARKADAEASKAESDVKIAALNTQAAEAQVKKSEEVMDMEAYYNKQSDKDKETKQLTKLAKYKHDLSNDDIEADTDYIETDIAAEDVNISGKNLNAALHSLLKQRN